MTVRGVMIAPLVMTVPQLLASVLGVVMLLNAELVYLHVLPAPLVMTVPQLLTSVLDVMTSQGVGLVYLHALPALLIVTVLDVVMLLNVVATLIAQLLGINVEQIIQNIIAGAPITEVVAVAHISYAIVQIVGFHNVKAAQLPIQ